MGMAASQARFLGLTSRKSNVEYQAQQVNQQRTTLANESANLYNQMMNLEVPTPPSTADFRKTVYVLEGSGNEAGNNYKIVNLSKIIDSNGKYNVTLSARKEYKESVQNNYEFQNIKDIKDGKEIKILDSNMKQSFSLIYKEGELEPQNKDNSLNIVRNQIYKADARIDGYNTCCTDANQSYYFYQDDEGKNHFLTEASLNNLLSTEDTKENNFTMYKERPYNKEESTQAKAYIEVSQSGRYSSISIEDDPDCAAELRNQKFYLSATQVDDEKGYNDAYNDYEYKKEIYEKTMSDINSKTKIIQSQDKRLETRLKQLDTEQNALKTEMDAVKGVIKANVEKTFNTFA